MDCSWKKTPLKSSTQALLWSHCREMCVIYTNSLLGFHSCELNSLRPLNCLGNKAILIRSLEITMNHHCQQPRTTIIQHIQQHSALEIVTDTTLSHSACDYIKHKHKAHTHHLWTTKTKQCFCTVGEDLHLRWEEIKDFCQSSILKATRGLKVWAPCSRFPLVLTVRSTSGSEDQRSN